MYPLGSPPLAALRRMGQQLAAVRLRLDNLFIKQSIIGRPEPYAAETKGAMSVTCGNWGPISEDAEAAEGFAQASRATGERPFTGNRRHFPLRKVAGPARAAGRDPHRRARYPRNRRRGRGTRRRRTRPARRLPPA